MSTAGRSVPSSNPLMIRHPLTPRDRSVIEQLRAAVEPQKGMLRGAGARAPFDAIISRTVAPDGVAFREDAIGGVPGWWCEAAGAAPDAAIVHFHGGWFSWGSSSAFRNLVGHIARGARANAFVPDYRLAPEHPFPAAIDDARACFRGLVERGIRAIAVTGDSAGGNLALSLLAGAARSAPGDARLVGAAVLSPVTDLSMTGRSWHSRAAADPYFTWEQAQGLIGDYLAGHAATDPVASPLFGNLVGLPPIRVHVGSDEVLLDDSVRYVEKGVTAGVDARLDVWDGMPHGFAGSIGRLDAAAGALGTIGAFLLSRLSATI